MCRILFWATWGRRPSITRARMDGSLIEPIIQNGISIPNGVAMDYMTDTLYWTDAGYHHIECSNMNGEDRRIILSSIFFSYYGFHILIKDGFLYWSEWADKLIYKASVPQSSSEIRPRDISKVLPFKEDYFNRPLGFTLVDIESPRQGGEALCGWITFL